MINRLIEPTSGKIFLDDEDVTRGDPVKLRRRMGYVIQQVGLFPHQTIGENVAVVPRLLGWPAARQQERAEELLTLVGLDPAQYRDRYPSQLSGGERQRVGVARALAADPPIMLMDEPFGAVDPIVRERLQDEFLRLQEEIAKTILFVTHDIDEAIKMGDLVAVLQVGGKLAQFGTPADLLASPASEFVARFVGADRGLKRLALSRIDDLTLQPAPTATIGTPAAEARRRGLADSFGFLLLVGPAGEPIGWLDAERLPVDGPLVESMANPTSPLLNKRTTLRDALSLLLDASVQVGIVTDRTGAVTGLVTIDMIAERMRSGHRAPAFLAQPTPADSQHDAEERTA
jgi:osmoprotectant transport system ATP-binding protein